MRYLNLLTAITGLLASCDEDQGNVHITGEFSGSPETVVYLQEWSNTGFTTVDSGYLEGDQFDFKAQIDEKAFYKLDFAPGKALNLILQPNESVNLIGAFSNPEGTYEVTGSEESILLREMLMKQYKHIVSRDSLQQLRNQFQNTGDLGGYYEVLAASQSKENEFTNSIVEFVTAHPKTLAALAAVRNLDPKQNLEAYQMVRDGLAETMPESEYFKTVNESISLIERFAVGATAPEIALPDLNGSVTKLSDLRGQVVLVDFWASWCRPCRMENPNVVAQYNLYQDKGFTVYSVSLDGVPRQQGDPRMAWQQAIQQDKLAWPHHVSDLQGWNSQAARDYGVEGIPYSLLLDRNGVILAKNLRGEALANELANLFNKESANS